MKEQTMNAIQRALLTLNTLYETSALPEYETALPALEEQVKKELPGFTIAHAVELSTVGAGEERYQHGGIGHVLLPLAKS
jgi:hypothetical protein